MLLAPAAVKAAPPGAAQGDEARLSLDLKDADATEVVALLAEAAGKQPVFDPGITCRLTLRVKETPWRSAIAAVLRACSLGVEESGSVLRIAPLSRLTAEETARRCCRSCFPAARCPTTCAATR